MTRRSFRCAAAFACSVLLAATGCNRDTTAPPDFPEGGLDIPILGKGIITDRYTAEVAAADNVAYTTTWGDRARLGNTTYVWNTAGDSPVLVDSLQVPNVSTMGDVEISPDGKYLVVATETLNGSIVVYDRSQDPLHPTFVSRFTNEHTTSGVHTMKMSMIGGKLYGFLQIDPTIGKARETIVDMTDPTNIVEVYSAIMGLPYVHDVFVRDGLLFTALWDAGMTIFDVGGGGHAGAPSNPIPLGSVNTTTGHIHNIWWYHDPHTGKKKYAFLGEEGRAVVLSTSSGDIHVVDVGDLTAPREVATFSVPHAGTHNFWVDEESGILYAAYYDGGVRAIDIRGDLGTCTAAQKTPEGLCSLDLMGRLAGKALDDGSYYVWGVHGVGNRLYVSDMNNGLVILDISQFKR